MASDEARRLDELRRQQQATLETLRERIAGLEQQREQAEGDRARLLDGIAGEGQDTEHRRVTLVLEKLDLQRAAYGESEISQLNDELSAAEELLQEVEHHRQSLESSLDDRGREVFKLKSEIDSIQRRSHEQRMRTMLLTRSHVRKTDVVASRMEDQLKRWVKKTGEANVNFSEHSHAAEVKEFFEKLDRDFIDRYFSHVTNPEYARGRNHVIRVNEEKDPGGGEFGELVIALDDDKGRTLGLRFEPRGGGPGVKYVGFVLAMYLRAVNRELKDFEIHA